MVTHNRQDLRRMLLPWVQGQTIYRRRATANAFAVSDNEALEELLEIIIGPWDGTSPESTQTVEIAEP